MAFSCKGRGYVELRNMHSRTPREQALWLSCRERAKPPTEEPAAARAEPDRTGPAGGDCPWAELLARAFAVDVLRCPSFQGRMRLLAVIKEPARIARYPQVQGAPP